MAERVKFSPLSEVKKAIEASFSIDGIKIDLAELPQEQELATLLQQVEDLAFNDDGEITTDGQEENVSELVVKICKEALNEFSKIKEVVDKNDSGKAGAMLSGEEFSPVEVSGAVDSSKTKELKKSIEALNNLIYTYLNKYAEQGYLTIEDMKDMGISEKDISVIEKNISKKLEEDLQNWKDGCAETSFPRLLQIKTETETDVNTSEEAEDQAQAVLNSITNIEDALQAANIIGEKYQFVEDKYLKKATERYTELNSIKDNLEKEEEKVEIKKQKDKEVDDFKESIKDFIEVIEIIPFSRKEIVTILNSDDDEEAHDPNDTKNSKRFEQQGKELKRRRTLLIDEKQKVESSGVLKKKDSVNSISADEINRVIDDVLRKSSEASSRVENLIKETDKPPIEEMVIDDIAAELIKGGHDPYFFEQMKSGAATNERAKELSDAFKGYWERDPESSPEEELNRVVQITKVQLVFLSSQLQEEPGLPSRERTQLWKEAIQRQMRRRELLMATTYHPEWGEETREMLEWSFKVAALRSGQILVRRKRRKGLRAGEEVLVAVYLNAKDGTDKKKSLGIKKTDKVLVRRKLDDDGGFEDIIIKWGDKKSGDKPLEQHSSDMFYGSLSKERGEYQLTQSLKERFPNGNPQAHEFAMSIFGSFDLLTISLGELQKNTMTRGHNADVKDKDRIMFADPLASAMHRAFRYWAEHEWSLRSLLFFEDVDNGDARYGIHDDKEEMKNHTWLSKLQKILLKHQSVFFDTKSFAGKIALPEFCEATGINTYDFLTLHSSEEFSMGNEALEMPDGSFVIHDGRTIKLEKRGEAEVWVDQDGKAVEKHLIPKRGENIAITKWYELAEENGFTQLLELTFKRMPVLSDEDIFRKSSDGSKGGVLSEWLQTAGRAKMFPGKHMKNYFEPLLANFVLRIFQQYKGRYNRDLRDAMFKEMIAALKASALDPAGLNAYKSEVANVINSLCEKDIWDTSVDETTGNKTAERNGNKAVQGESVKPWDDRREGKRNIYLDAWYRWKNHGHAPPIHLLGVALDKFARPLKSLRASLVGKNPEDVEFIEIIQGKKSIPDLLERTGDLMQKDDKSS